MLRRNFIFSSLSSVLFAACSTVFKPNPSSKVIVTMRLDFPAGKSGKDYLSDRELWTSSGFKAHIKSYEDQGKLLGSHTTFAENHLVTKMLFKSQHDLDSFHDYVLRNSLMNRKIRDDLGYSSNVSTQKIS